MYPCWDFSYYFLGYPLRVIAQPARDLMETTLPVWRGVVKNNRILIAAQNPHAGDGQQTRLTVAYGNWKRVITLTGKEIFLCDFDLDEAKSGIDSLTVSPNPARTDLNVTLSVSGKEGNIDFTLYDIRGARVVNGSFVAAAGTAGYHLTLPRLPAGLYIARFTSERNSLSRKVIIY